MDEPTNLAAKGRVVEIALVAVFGASSIRRTAIA